MLRNPRFVYAAWHRALLIKISIRYRQLFLVRSVLRSCLLRKIMRNGLHILQTFPDTTFTKCHCYLTHSEIVTDLTQVVSRLGQRQCIVTADFKLLKRYSNAPLHWSLDKVAVAWLVVSNIVTNLMTNLVHNSISSARSSHVGELVHQTGVTCL